jgi:hypothetical protein
MGIPCHQTRRDDFGHEGENLGKDPKSLNLKVVVTSEFYPLNIFSSFSFRTMEYNSADGLEKMGLGEL